MLLGSSVESGGGVLTAREGAQAASTAHLGQQWGTCLSQDSASQGTGAPSGRTRLLPGLPLLKVSFVPLGQDATFLQMVPPESHNDYFFLYSYCNM